MSDRYRGSEDPRSFKKQREQRVGTALQALVPEVASCDLRLGIAGREPDLVCQSAHGSHGIEVVQYFSPEKVGNSSLAKQQSLADRVAYQATAICTQLGLQHVFGHVAFTFDVEIRSQNVPHLAQAVTSVIRPVAAGAATSVTCRDRSVLPKPINEVWICRRDNVPEPFVGHQYGGTVSKMNLIHLQELIAGKENKLAIYRSSCARVWLVILVDPRQVASMAYVPPSFRINHSGFDRVLVLQSWSYTIDLWNMAA